MRITNGMTWKPDFSSEEGGAGLLYQQHCKHCNAALATSANKSAAERPYLISLANTCVKESDFTDSVSAFSSLLPFRQKWPLI